MIETVVAYEYNNKVYKTKQEALDAARLIILRKYTDGAPIYHGLDPLLFIKYYDKIMKELAEIV